MKLLDAYGEVLREDPEDDGEKLFSVLGRDPWQYRALGRKGERGFVRERMDFDRLAERWTLTLRVREPDVRRFEWRLLAAEDLPAGFSREQLASARSRLADLALRALGYDPAAEYLKAVVAGDAA